jgi:oligopeptidase B
MVDRGFIYAIAHIRGGQEMGRRWYDDGKMLKKKNTFNDFIDVAEELIRRKYTTSERLVANGGSAAGCSWVRWPTCAPTCSGPSSRTCRSLM